MINLNSTAGIPARYANRHGLITGQTGTGKTVTLMTLAERFSRAGVPVFIADVKGDIAALARSCPAVQLDLFGHAGNPIRVSFDAMGADLVARALELTDAQSGVVEVAFAYARDNRLALASIADFRAVLARLHADAKAISAQYGQVGAASIAVVQRALMRLEGQGGRTMFAYPAFDVAELLEPSRISILKADRLMQSPRLYGAFLLWMLSDLYERLPEIGDQPAPRLVFFFDEAHLLFQDCPAALLRRIEQTVRLIRSKGVGVYFVTQAPDDVPTVIRDQLAHRIEHDRALPVGVARFRTMTREGKPAPMITAKVDLPECPLGPLQAHELPPSPAPGASAAPSQWPAVALIAAGVVLAAFLAWWLIAAGHTGKAVAVLAGLAIFARIRR